MTSPREQAIEAAALEMDPEAFLFGPKHDRRLSAIAKARRGIDRYEAARARLDGAKMMPRDATEEQMAAASKAFMGDINCNYDDIWRAMHDATPKEGERG